MKRYTFGRAMANCPDIEEIIDDLCSIFVRIGVSEAYLFGSHVRGKANRYSDIDILVVTDTPDIIIDYANELCQFNAVVDIKAITHAEADKIKNKRQHWLKSGFKGWRIGMVN